MDIDLRLAKPPHAPERIFMGAATLKSLRGSPGVEIQLFRYGHGENIDTLKDKSLVAPPDPAIPAEVLSGASEAAALEFILEAFTSEEAEAIAHYLAERYNDQIENVIFCPMDVPVPLGVGPLAKIPETAGSGFIKFDLAPDFPLPFKFRGYFEINPK